MKMIWGNQHSNWTYNQRVMSIFVIYFQKYKNTILGPWLPFKISYTVSTSENYTALRKKLEANHYKMFLIKIITSSTL